MRKQEVIKAIAETIAEYRIKIDKSNLDSNPAYYGVISGVKVLAEKLNLDRYEIEMLSEEIYFSNFSKK